MSNLSVQLDEILNCGAADRLYSGASVAVFTPQDQLVFSYVGTHAYGDDRGVSATSLFDLASVSKAFVATTILSLIEEGTLDPEQRVAEILKVGTGDGAEEITLRHLLTHTAGLPGDVFVWKEPTLSLEERWVKALAAPLHSRPDSIFHYACIGYIAAGRIAELVTGKTLVDLVTERIIHPLKLPRTQFGPVSREIAVATEDESFIGRGIVRGEVHDELAWSLGGHVGNAGIFSTAADVLTFARSLLSDGSDGAKPILGAYGRHLISTSFLTEKHGTAFGHSMGLRIGDPVFMGAVQGLGHTGFTGTMFVVDTERDTVTVLLTNRVHPSRELVDLQTFRSTVVELVAAHVDRSR